jgi:transposase-like protein
MTHHAPDATTIDAALKLLTEHGYDDMARAIEILLGEAMKIERSAFPGASPYERTEERLSYANGYKRKSVSSRSRAAQLLHEALDAWRTRPLGKCRYLILDARYEKVRRGGQVASCTVLGAAGVDATSGKRRVLGVSAALSEAEVHWQSLKDRGLHGIELITSDDHAGLEAAVASLFHGTAWQRCQSHLQQNAGAYVPRTDMRKQVARDIRSVFNAPDRVEAERLLGHVVERYRDSAAKLPEWLETNIPEDLAVFALPDAHRRRLRTSNLMERVKREIRRRTRVATLFPNEASLLRHVTAVVAEISQEWETGRTDLSMDPE